MSINSIYTFLFCLFLIPFSTVDGISINYSFVIFPILFILFTGKITRPPIFVLLSLLGYLAIFFIGIFFNLFENIDLIGRSIISFLIFISTFAFTFIPIKSNIILSFKNAIVLTATTFSIISIYKFVNFRIDDLGLVKELIGSQRIGFIHTVAIFILIIRQDNFYLKPLIRYSTLLLVVIGLFLTFSRTPIISIIISYILFKSKDFKVTNFLHIKWYKTIITGFASLLSLILIVYFIFPDLFLFFNDILIERFFFNESNEILLDPETSEGTRVEIWRTILNYCIYHPLHGSGFLGAYVLESTIVFGSSHSQYMDVFLRSGFIGVFIYFYLLFVIAKDTISSDKSLFWGFISILFYGLFHETFKESQGGFIFAFYLGLASYSKSQKYLYNTSVR